MPKSPDFLNWEQQEFDCSLLHMPHPYPTSPALLCTNKPQQIDIPGCYFTLVVVATDKLMFLQGYEDPLLYIWIEKHSRLEFLSFLYDLISFLALALAASIYAMKHTGCSGPQPVTYHHRGPTSHSFWGITVPCPLLIKELSSKSLLLFFLVLLSSTPSALAGAPQG